MSCVCVSVCYNDRIELISVQVNPYSVISSYMSCFMYMKAYVSFTKNYIHVLITTFISTHTNIYSLYHVNRLKLHGQ